MNSPKKFWTLYRNRGIGIIDAIVEVCDREQLEVESAKDLLTDEILYRLEIEALEMNLLVAGNTEPLEF